jgi:hypothetical protein
MTMELITSDGRVRRVCDRCHKVSVRFKTGPLCDSCRQRDRAAIKAANRRYEKALQIQAQLRESHKARAV